MVIITNTSVEDNKTGAGAMEGAEGSPYLINYYHIWTGAGAMEGAEGSPPASPKPPTRPGPIDTGSPCAQVYL